MSEHSIPPDPANWPSDPYLLLGVDRGVSARDLRKAYLRLIRAYKPEHSPEEFKRIRDAYESTLPFAQFLDRNRNQASSEGEGGDEPEADPPPTPSTDNPPWRIVIPRSDRPDLVESSRADSPEPSTAPWDLACRGESDAAYRALVEVSTNGRAQEETYLQLYWLLALQPGLDKGRLPIDWLIRGLGASGPDSVRLRELLKRELAADPTLATGDRLAALFRRKTPPAVVLDVAEGRWRAARMARRWALILADVQTLRVWLPEVDEDSWARLLLAASTNLAWAESPDSDRAATFAREVERLGDRHRDYSEDLYQVEYVQMVKAGLGLLGGRTGAFSGIFQLLSISWDERGPEFRTRLRSYSGQIAQDTRASLACFDHIHAVAPVVLARLSTLLGDLDFEEYRYIGSTLLAEVAPGIERFLSASGWTDYPLLRPNLLQFCLREAISPGLVARTMAERPEFILTGKSPLAQTIAGDWPLRHVYRACELTWEEPAQVRFGD
jgi:hypothetical protein